MGEEREERDGIRAKGEWSAMVRKRLAWEGTERRGLDGA
jgi:hypothetical protein